MFTDNKIWMAQSEDKNLYLLPKMANRHGIIAGATGTGKTVTMKVMAESFSDMGVPVFLCDVKGDLSGMCVPGSASESLQERINGFGIENFAFKSYPTRFWDIFGEQGHPVRVTVSEMGPTLLGRLFGLTEIQTGVLNIVFRVADDNGLLLLDLKDLRAMLQYVGDNRAEFTTEYGNVSAASIGAIQRALLAFEDEGGDTFFGEPGLDITDWMRTDAAGRGYINILTSKRLIASPLVYSTFLLWMVTELYEKLPEVGDPEKPRMIFFFDEAHLLFPRASASISFPRARPTSPMRSSRSCPTAFSMPCALIRRLSRRPSAPQPRPSVSTVSSTPRRPFPSLPSAKRLSASWMKRASPRSSSAPGSSRRRARWVRRTTA